jgi:CRP-like cAMP-binding protein
VQKSRVCHHVRVSRPVTGQPGEDALTGCPFAARIGHPGRAWSLQSGRRTLYISASRFTTTGDANGNQKAAADSDISMGAPDVNAERVVAWLATCRFCAGLDSEAVKAIACQVQVRPFTAGETLASVGDAVTEFWIVAEGELDTFLMDARGRESHLVLVNQGESLGAHAILENMPTRPVRFVARTHGTLLVAPAEMLRVWIENYPHVMQNLFATLSHRFEAVAGAASRKLPSPRLGIIVTSPRGYLLAGRLASRLLAVGERLRVWARQPLPLKSTGSWPEELPIHELAAEDAPCCGLPRPTSIGRLSSGRRA